MAQSESYFFFAPVSLISRTADRTKANTYERKRTLPVHAKFVLTENRHYFAHFPHNGFGDALLAHNYCAYNCVWLTAHDNAYNVVILTRNYCAYNGMAFVARHTRYDAGDFVVSLLHIWWHWFHGASYRVSWRAFLASDICALSQVLFMARYSPYKAGCFGRSL